MLEMETSPIRVWHEADYSLVVSFIAAVVLPCIFNVSWRLLSVMENKQGQDLARVTAAELRNVRFYFEEADEVYRRLRVHILADPPPPQCIPCEWIPISKH